MQTSQTKLTDANRGWVNRKAYKRLDSRQRRRAASAAVRSGQADALPAVDRRGYRGWIW